MDPPVLRASPARRLVTETVAETPLSATSVRCLSRLTTAPGLRHHHQSDRRAKPPRTKMADRVAATGQRFLPGDGRRG